MWISAVLFITPLKLGLKQSWILSIKVLSRDNDRVFMNTVTTCSITTWLLLICRSLQVAMLHTRHCIPDKNLCHWNSTAFIVLLPDSKYIMWAGSHDLNEYLSTNFTISLVSTHQILAFVSVLIKVHKHVAASCYCFPHPYGNKSIQQ